MFYAVVERRVKGRSRIIEVIPSISLWIIKPAMTVTNQLKAAFLEKQGWKHNRIFSINLSIDTFPICQSLCYPYRQDNIDFGGVLVFDLET